MADAGLLTPSEDDGGAAAVPPGLIPVWNADHSAIVGYDTPGDWRNAPLDPSRANVAPEDKPAGDPDPIAITGGAELPLPPVPPASIPTRVLQAINPIGSAEAAPRRLPLPDAYPLDAHGQRIMPADSAAPADTSVNAGHMGDSRPLPTPALTDESGQPIIPPPAGALPSL